MLVYVGSANLTQQAMEGNTECGALFTSDSIPQDTSNVFSKIWRNAPELNENSLREYTAKFTKRNRKRSAIDLQELGVSNVPDVDQVTSTTIQKQPKPTPSSVAIGSASADTVWVGLETSTGAYVYQPEFPKTVGAIVRRILLQRNIQPQIFGQGGRRREVFTIPVLCTDGNSLPMDYTYYQANGMSRLNIPNEVPNAAWARQEKKGIAVISRSADPTTVISLDILMPGAKADEVVRLSYALGSWARTPTRAYGWY